MIVSCAILFTTLINPVFVSAAKDSETLKFAYGTLKSDAWRSTLTSSGNTYKFDYQTSAVYSGSKTVERIRTTWTVGASLRNSANMSIGTNNGSVSVGAGSSWTNVSRTAYWENSNGAKGSYSERRNAIIAPSRDYRSNTVYIINDALIKIKGDARTFAISASV